MLKKIFLFLILIIFLTTPALAQGNNFVSIVNPIRGGDFWEGKQKIEEVVIGQTQILKQANLEATWLLRFDALGYQSILNLLNQQDEKGLFLEVTPSWCKSAGVNYHVSESWHSAGSAFLTGYEINERQELIDEAFEKFKNVFGYFPKSVGAWWIDGFSLNYMQTKYAVTSALIVADQYSTDNYQIWGQYFSTPYYPDKKDALHPAQSIQNKIPVVISQWAVRDPVNSYGNGVAESTFSIQANDYLDFHKLDINYFSKLLDIYLNQKFNQYSALVVGLENTYSWEKYGAEYKKQIELLLDKQKQGILQIITLHDFASWYIKTFPDLSPAQIIVADDPLGTEKKTVWFMNPYFRVGWFYNKDGAVFRDIRQYIEGDEELCMKKRCDSVNFATSAVRVLDEVSFGHKWVIDGGKISDFDVFKDGDKFIINYKNEAGKIRKIEFLPRDIGIDGKISSVDGAILDAIKIDNLKQSQQANFKKGGFDFNIFSILIKTAKFLILLVMVILIPGLVFTSKVKKDENFFKHLFIAVISGLVFLTITFYITSLLHLRFLIFFYILINLFIFFKLKLFKVKIALPKMDILDLTAILVIALGTIFQIIPAVKNGLTFSFGMGLWGPNTHDGIWHISLINQLVKNVPPQNPIFASSILRNYHFFYDLLIAATTFLTNIPVIDLVFRFYPTLFSMFLGLGTYYLTIGLSRRTEISRAKLAAILSILFVYFAGSFGWIIDFIKNKSFAGESAFWANQSISFNLNPPFALSLLIVIAIIILLQKDNKRIKFVLIMLIGSLVGFKAYAAILVILSLFSIVLINTFKRDFKFFYVLIFSTVLSVIIFLSNFTFNKSLMVFSPFWFIHSMIDSPDRVGWLRLTLMRTVGFETKNWFKFITAETISLLLFVFGNLGTRFLSIFSLHKIKSIARDNQLLFLFVLSVLSFTIPVLFIQSGNPWNTIQFLYYGLYMTSVISGLVLIEVITKIPKNLAILIIGLILLITPINSITTASYYTGFLPHARISTKELESLKFLSTQEEGVVLTYPYEERFKKSQAEPWPLYVYDSTAYVSALSKKAVYLEDESQNQILLTDYQKRLVASKDFFYNSTNGDLFLNENNIAYIYLPKIYKISINQHDNLKVIFENEEVIIYKRS